MDNSATEHDISYSKDAVCVDGIDIEQEVLKIMGISNLAGASIEIHKTTPEELSIFN